MPGLNFNTRLFCSICSKVLLLLALLCSLAACMQESEQEGAEEAVVVDPLVGAWGGQAIFKDQSVDVVVIFTLTHQVAAWYNASTGALASTNGGLWSRTGIHVTEKVEFDSDWPERVGTDVSFDIELINDSLSIVGSDSWLIRIDQGDQNRLEGGWELEGNSDSTPSVMNSKRIRLMSSTRYQEVEYEPESGKLLTTIGGSYQIDDMSYIEKPLFSTSLEDVDVQAESFTFEREGRVWRQVGTDEMERVWQGF